MNLTITSQDVFGRATVQAPAGSTYAWSKSKDGSAFVSAPEQTGQAWVDNRPTQHWKPLATRSMGSGSITFTGESIALYGLWLPSTSIYFKITDSEHPTGILAGSIHKDFIIDNRRVTPHRDEMFWGVSGLSNIEHTLTMYSDSGMTSLYDIAHSYLVRDFYATYEGSSITYKCIVTGGVNAGTHTFTLTDGIIPDRRGATKSIIDRMLAVYDSDAPFGYSIVFGDEIGALAGMYAMADATQKEAIYNLAVTEYDRYKAQCWTPDDVGYSSHQSRWGLRIAEVNYSVDSRIVTGMHSAYRIFKTDYPEFAQQLLDVCDICVKTYRDYISASSGYAYNQVANYAFSIALLYNDPSSIWYQDSTMLTKIQWFLDFAYNDNGGCYYNTTLPYTYYPDGDTMIDAEDSYALYCWLFFQYCADTIDWHKDESDNITTWLSDRWESPLGGRITEPFFYYSAYYDGIQAECLLKRLHAHYRAHGTMPEEMVHALYSAAFDTDDYATCDNQYKPQGFNTSASYPSLTPGAYDVYLFQAMAALFNSGVPLSAWMWIPPPPPYIIKNPDGTPGGDILNPDGSPGGTIVPNETWQ